MTRYQDFSEGFPYKESNWHHRPVVIWLLLTCTDTETKVMWNNISWLFWEGSTYNGNIVQQHTCVCAGSIRHSVKAALHWI